MARTVSDRIVEFLAERGVERIFGIPGDTIDSLMESLRKQKAVHFVVIRHEEAGAFAASAQAKLTGHLSVCVGCQGPGAVHLLNGLYDAALDRVPVPAITGQIPRDELRTGMPQEIDQLRLFGDVAIYNAEVRSPENLEPVLSRAVREAQVRKGVAHVSIPSDVMRLPVHPRPPADREGVPRLDLWSVPMPGGVAGVRLNRLLCRTKVRSGCSNLIEQFGVTIQQF